MHYRVMRTSLLRDDEVKARMPGCATKNLERSDGDALHLGRSASNSGRA